MLKKLNKILLSTGMLSAALFAHATSVPTKHIIIAPSCLVSKMANSHTTLSTKSDLNLIEVTKAGIDELIELKHSEHCGGFIDVTSAWSIFQKKANADAKNFLTNYTQDPTPKAISSYQINYQTQTNALIKAVNPQIMWSYLQTLSSMNDRYAGSQNGVKAAHWLQEQVEKIAADAGRHDVTSFFVSTTSQYIQPSLVVKVGEGAGPGIVIGGHMDTVESSASPKPGADDDGSGTVTVLETARVILNSDLRFQKPIYFIWYSAEEEGLVGSEHVVSYFQSHNIPVDAVLQLDMTGYRYRNDPTIWLINDHVNKNLTNYLAKLISTYVKQPVDYTRCNYACSDHASWTQAGYASSMPFETAFGNDNPDVHTSKDTMDKLSLDHMSNFAKLATAFAVELAEPK